MEHKKKSLKKLKQPQKMAFNRLLGSALGTSLHYGNMSFYFASDMIYILRLARNNGKINDFFVQEPAQKPVDFEYLMINNDKYTI